MKQKFYCAKCDKTIDIKKPQKQKHPVFYLIWTATTGYAKYRHATYESAATEIKRLHKLEPKKTFYILKAIAKMSKNRKKKEQRHD